jgi:hypothetical protein
VSARAFIEQTASGRWRWRIVDPREGVLREGRVAYERLGDCRRGLARFRNRLLRAPIVVVKRRKR